MILSASYTDITIPESLGLSVLGMLVVFLVLVFLMVIIYIMTAVIRQAAKRKKTVIGSASADAAALVPSVTHAAVEAVASADNSAAPVAAASDGGGTGAVLDVSATCGAAAPLGGRSVAGVPAAVPPAPKKYRVIVNGVEYEVDAESGDTVVCSGAPEAVVPSDAAAAVTSAVVANVAATMASARVAAPVAIAEFEGVRKFRVVVDGVEYEVDAETGSANVNSMTGGSV